MKLESYSKKTEQVDEYEKFNHSYLEGYNHDNYEEEVATLESVPKEIDEAILAALEGVPKGTDEAILAACEAADEAEHRAKREERKKELIAMKKGLEETKYGYEGVSYGGEAFNTGKKDEEEFDSMTEAREDYDRLADAIKNLF